MKIAPLSKRKRKVAGPKIAPLTSMPSVEPLSDAEWQTFLQRLPCRPRPTLLRNKLDLLMTTYLGVIEAEANSPSAREVATVLEELARRAHQFAHDLLRLDIRIGNEGPGAFNTANEAAADILTNISIKPENRPVLGAALWANEVLAAVAAREARRLGERSKKGRPTYGQPTAWLLRQLVQLLRDNGLSISLRPKWGDPICVLGQHFLRVALTRAETLREPEWACKEIQAMLMLSRQAFAGRLRQAAQPHG